MSMQKLHQMPFDVFERKQSALPQFKRLYKRTLRATRDDQKLAPRNTRHEFYYRLFEEFVFLLDMQNDQLLEIEETMESLVELHEYRKQTLTQQTLTQQTYEFKPVKDRPPTPLPRPNLRMILRNIDLTLAQSSSKSRTPPPASPSGYSSSSSGSSGKTTTTTTTTVVRHNWSDSDDSDDSSTCSRQSKR